MGGEQGVLMRKSYCNQLACWKLARHKGSFFLLFFVFCVCGGGYMYIYIYIFKGGLRG